MQHTLIFKLCLSCRLAHEGRCFTAYTALTVTLSAAKQLQTLHAAGWLHLDIKASNILLHPTCDGQPGVLLADFGIAERVGAATAGKQGTPGYQAPEIMQVRRSRHLHASRAIVLANLYNSISVHLVGSIFART